MQEKLMNRNQLKERFQTKLRDLVNELGIQRLESDIHTLTVVCTSSNFYFFEENLKEIAKLGADLADTIIAWRKKNPTVEVAGIDLITEHKNNLKSK